MAMWAGVQNVSRPIERCHEMSQTTPTFALVAAISAAATYQGTPPGRGAAPVRGSVAAVTGYRSREPPETSPLPRHFSKIFFTCWCASARASLAVIRPVAAFANMVGNTNVSNTSLSAGLAGPGWPIFVAHCRAVEIGLSLPGGLEPNGSLDVTCSSHLVPDAGFCPTATPASATDPVNDGKLYSLLPSTASRY